MNYLRNLWSRMFGTPDDIGGDVSAFDAIEALGRSLCREAGGDWEKRRAYWNRKAVETVRDAKR